CRRSCPWLWRRGCRRTESRWPRRWRRHAVAPPRGGAAGCEVSPYLGSGEGLASVPGVLSSNIHSTDLRISADFFSQSAADLMAAPRAPTSVSVILRAGYFERSTVSLT